MHHEEFGPLTLPHQRKSSCPNNKEAYMYWLETKNIENVIGSVFYIEKVIWMGLPTKRK